MWWIFALPDGIVAGSSLRFITLCQILLDLVACRLVLLVATALNLVVEVTVVVVAEESSRHWISIKRQSAS